MFGRIPTGPDECPAPIQYKPRSGATSNEYPHAPPLKDCAGFRQVNNLNECENHLPDDTRLAAFFCGHRATQTPVDRLTKQLTELQPLSLRVRAHCGPGVLSTCPAAYRPPLLRNDCGIAPWRARRRNRDVGIDVRGVNCRIRCCVRPWFDDAIARSRRVRSIVRRLLTRSLCLGWIQTRNNQTDNPD
jgi:hypothetical protein